MKEFMDLLVAAFVVLRSCLEVIVQAVVVVVIVVTLTVWAISGMAGLLFVADEALRGSSPPGVSPGEMAFFRVVLASWGLVALVFFVRATIREKKRRVSKLN